MGACVRQGQRSQAEVGSGHWRWYQRVTRHDFRMEELLDQLAREAGAERRDDIRQLADQARSEWPPHCPAGDTGPLHKLSRSTTILQ